MATVVYGNEIAKSIKENLKIEIDQLKENGKRIPKLVVLLIGDNQASIAYVTGKEKACHAIGMENILMRLPDTISEEEVLMKIRELNKDDTVDGILVQLPLPSHIDEHKVLLEIDSSKDVDGFHPYNVGKLMLQEDTFVSCTPKGILRILETIGYDDLSGKIAVVVGRSNIVGKPVAQLLLQKNATVMMCHSKTKDIEKITSQADILVVAIGKAKLIKQNWVKKDAIIIDVGMNRDEHNKLCGDVDFNDVFDKTSYITPVPKGVGPMTIAMLLENTLESYRRKK